MTGQDIYLLSLGPVLALGFGLLVYVVTRARSAGSLAGTASRDGVGGWPAEKAQPGE